MSGKNQPRNGRLRALSAGRRTGGAGLCRRDSSCSAARIPVQDLGSVHPRPQPPGGRSATRMRVRHLHRSRLRYFAAVQPPPAVRIMFLTSGAKGTRTPDPLLANNRQHVHPRPSPQVTIPERVSASLQIRTCCGTSVLYSPPESTPVRRLCGTPRRHPARISARPAERARGSWGCKLTRNPGTCH